MIKHFCSVWTALLFLTLFESPLQGQNTLENQESRLTRMMSELNSSNLLLTQLMDQAAGLAHEIELTKKKTLLSPGDHRRLERLLQQTQQLETRVRAVRLQIQQQTHGCQEAVDRLVSSYQGVVDSLIQLSENAPQERRDGLLGRIAGAMNRKVYWETVRKPEVLADLSSIDIRSNPWDTPLELRMKGDLLLDREEVLRGEIVIIEKRLKSLSDEERIRRKISEMAQELEMFDEREELFGREIPISNTRDLYGQAYQHNDTDPAISGKEFYKDDINLILSSPTPRSPSTILQWINLLKQYRNRISAQADSLHHRAELFHKQAEEKRD